MNVGQIVVYELMVVSHWLVGPEGEGRESPGASQLRSRRARARTKMSKRGISVINLIIQKQTEGGGDQTPPRPPLAASAVI